MEAKVWLLAALVLGSFAFFAAQPRHAQCKAIWILKTPCLKVEEALVNQIDLWKTAGGCVTDGEKCQYELISANLTQVIARHTTPNSQNVDNINFFLKSDPEHTMCRVVGISVSMDMDRVYDNGTNYCNMYNLLEGSGLTNLPDYKEISNDWMCTQHSMANCTIY